MPKSSGLLSILLLAAAAGQQGYAQSGILSSPSVFGGGTQNGFHVYSASSFAGYSTKTLPDNSGFALGDFGLGSDMEAGGSVTMGWNHVGPKSNSSITYTSSYLGRVRYSEWNAFNHSLSGNHTRSLGGKWKLTLAASGAVSSLDQFLFTPTQFSTVAAIPASFDDLAAAMVAGTFSNNQLASILTGAPVIDSPATTLLYGNRYGTVSARAGLTYHYSPRLSVSFDTGANLIEHLHDSGTKSLPRNSYLFSRGETEQAGVSLTYSLSPRTNIGIGVQGYRTNSSIQDSTSSVINASLSRTMGRHWFASVTAGGGYVSQNGGIYRVRTGTQSVGGGNLGYKTFAHTLLASYNRTVNDLSGFGGPSQTMSGSWNWARPGRNWGLHSSMSYQRYATITSDPLSGWLASGGVSRAINRNVTMYAEYAHLSNSGRYSGNLYDFSRNSVRVSVTWAPGANSFRR